MLSSAPAMTNRKASSEKKGTLPSKATDSNRDADAGPMPFRTVSLLRAGRTPVWIALSWAKEANAEAVAAMICASLFEETSCSRLGRNLPCLLSALM
jgi:hypothetical protein